MRDCPSLRTCCSIVEVPGSTRAGRPASTTKPPDSWVAHISLTLGYVGTRSLRRPIARVIYSGSHSVRHRLGTPHIPGCGICGFQTGAPPLSPAFGDRVGSATSHTVRLGETLRHARRITTSCLIADLTSHP